MTSIKCRPLVSISATFSTTGLIELTSFKPPLLSFFSLTVTSLTSFDLSLLLQLLITSFSLSVLFALLLLITSLDLSVLFALVLSLISFYRSSLILHTAVLSLFPLLVIPYNSAELATRELNFWLLVKQILKVGLRAELLLSADEP